MLHELRAGGFLALPFLLAVVVVGSVLGGTRRAGFGVRLDVAGDLNVVVLRG